MLRRELAGVHRKKHSRAKHVDGKSPPNIITRLRKHLHTEQRSNPEPLFTRSTDIIRLFLILCIISLIFLGIPLLITPNDPIKDKVIFQLILFLILGSICWEGFVYLWREFKNLVRTKVVPVMGQEEVNQFEPMFIFIFNGILFEWRSGKSFRFLWIDIFILIALHDTIYSFILPNLSKVSFTPFNFDAILLFFVMVLTFLISFFFELITLSTLIWVMSILFFFIMAIQIFRIEINPYIEMGGTRKFGEIVISCLYYSAFAIGIFPLLSIVSTIDFSKILTLQNTFSSLENQSWTNVTFGIKDTIFQQLDRVPIGSFSIYLVWMIIFGAFVLLALIIIIMLHYRITERKREEQKKLEELISSIDFNSENFENRDRNQYLLSVYRELTNLYEWPVKKIFVLNLLIAIMLLFISRLFK